jgi:hypothetical protein
MKRYRLMTEIGQYPVGTLFTFEQKHRLMESLPWHMTRAILWETVEIWH